ncbi:NB-ARC domain-containing protein [Lentzea sp. HUAS12]|uniref:ATP-binding protein n=1 Tax=Lentzea sp. HUAS12 TaxID=2951806 RepID=UPI0020A047D9|nr:NB-ARC domain-containing protein [Lentzea sp. HUAS12]USX55522.1 NB-ARC domain-containing protein [Lentzea sp. HUAS12]
MVESECWSTFGELLLGHRRAAGLSQQGLAERSGISVRALRELEQGRARAAQRRSAEVLADAFGLGGAQREEFLRIAEEGRRRRSSSSVASIAELPPMPVDRVGRGRELSRLQECIRTSPSVAMVGQPGVGKTVLAASAAHHLRDEFPDGCLAVDLRGVDEQPLPVQIVFDRLLRALGVAASDVPTAVTEQSGQYRAVLQNRKVLVLLDNAASEVQVRPLLTASPGCRTLVTCRRMLAGLEGVRWVHLDPFDDVDAEALLEAVVGEGRVRAEPGVVGELIELCGNLPLALRIAGNRLASRPHWSLRYLVEQLRDERTRLSSLSAGDLQVRSAFEVSYRGLSPEGRMFFRRLAALPGADFGVELAQVAGGVTEREAFGLLDELVDASMVLAGPAEGRFRFHDLLRLFARERWETEDDEADRSATAEAVLEHLLGMAIAAGERFSPEELANEVFDSLDEARTWLEQERSGWLAAFREAARTGWHREVVILARAMHWYADDDRYGVDWVEVFGAGVAAARTLRDVSAEARQRNLLGRALVTARDCAGAVEQHRIALRCADEVGDPVERVWALAHLTAQESLLGDRKNSLEHARQAVELSAPFPFWSVRMTVRFQFGVLLLLDGRPEDALVVLEDLRQDAVRHSRDGEVALPRTRLLAMSIEGVARCLHAVRQCCRSAAMFAEARGLYEKVGASMHAARAAFQEGRCRLDSGEDQVADTLFRCALATFDELSRPEQRAEVEVELARISAR